jgi:hypothetical protein
LSGGALRDAGQKAYDWRREVQMSFENVRLVSLPGLAALGVLAGCGGEPASLPAASSEAPLVIGQTRSAADQWTWTDLPETRCRNGSTTGIGVRRKTGSHKIMLYVDGGGACFSWFTCNFTNPTPLAVRNKFDYNDFKDYVTGTLVVPDQLRQGVFDLDHWFNPVDHMNQLFVPYCTGDFHAGNAPNQYVGPGPAPYELHNQQFVGWNNMTVYLAYINQVFASELAAPDAEVVLIGESAGAAGVLFNAHRFAAGLPAHVRLTVISDSAPPFDETLRAPCVQNFHRQIYNFDSTFLADCGADCPHPDNWSVDWHLHVMNRNYGSRDIRFAMVSSDDDGVIKASLGIGPGQGGCSPTAPSQPAFDQGLRDIQTRMENQSVVTGTFLVSNSTEHTFLGWDRFYPEWEGLVPLTGWVNNMIGDPEDFDDDIAHVGP